jgi:hypothetical protein
MVGLSPIMRAVLAGDGAELRALLSLDISRSAPGAAELRAESCSLLWAASGFADCSALRARSASLDFKSGADESAAAATILLVLDAFKDACCWLLFGAGWKGIVSFVASKIRPL